MPPPNLLQPTRIRFATILLAIKAQLIASNIVPADKVNVIGHDVIPKLKGEQNLYVRPRLFYPLPSQVESAGRSDVRLTRRFDILIENRIGTDPVNSDEAWLTDPNGRGYFDLEEAVLDSLELFQPVDANGNELTAYPMRLLGGDQPDKDRQKQTWGGAALTFEVCYFPPITQNAIPNV